MKNTNAYTVAFLINQKGPNVADAIVKAIDDMTMEDLAEFKRYMAHGTFIKLPADLRVF